MKRKKIKKTYMIYLIIAISILCVIALSVYIIKRFSSVTTDDAYIDGRVHMVASKISGTVNKVYVIDNQKVKKGEVLVEIDSKDYELRVSEARANLDIRKASFEQALRDKERAETLHKEGVYSQERYENTITSYNLAKAQTEAAEAQLIIAQRNTDYTRIYSPSDGCVTRKSVEAGNQIQPNSPLMAVVALDDIWLVANYKETQLKNVRPGQRVQIKVDTYPSKTFTGRVDSIMAGTGAAFSLFPAENALGNYVKVVQRIPVKIVLDKISDNPHVLRIGMSCIPTIITKDE